MKTESPTEQIWQPGQLNPNVADLAPQVAKILQFRNDPSRFVHRVLGVENPEPYQLEILEAVASHDRVATHTGHGVGKTALAAWAVIWFMFTWGPCKVPTTAPSWRQVEDLLWAEVHKWIRKAKLEEELGWRWPYKLLDTRLEIMQDWYATGEASDVPEKMEGYHAPALLFVVDEAKAVPDPTFESIEGALTEENAKELLISTPGDESGFFYKVCSGDIPGWFVKHVNGEDSPRVTQGWVDRQKAQWGEDSPSYKRRVQGLFSSSEDDTVIHGDWITKAAARSVVGSGQKVLGADIGNRGGDDTVLTTRHGPLVHPQVVLRRARTGEIVRTIVALWEDERHDVIVIDANGVGAGVYDDLTDEQAKGKIPYTVEIIPFLGSEKSSDIRAYLNRRAEVWWATRVKFQPTLGFLGIPDDRVLREELISQKYLINTKEQIQIESKEV
ncbi:MAG: hypothetical protein QQN63_11530, partial [Nitrosopumilus sp.]